jgi:aspartate/methionine/tyrosine aminotransferase
MYIWAKLPDKFQKMGSLKFCEQLLLKTGISMSPGAAFGDHGEGYVRIAMVTHINRFHDMALRMKDFFKNVGA